MSQLKLIGRGGFARIKDASPSVKKTEKQLCVLTA